MERRMYFAENPQPMEWGEKKNVPLNVTVETSFEDGEQKSFYRADIVPKVNEPLTVDNIVEAAINSEYSEAEQKRILRNIDNASDEGVQKYKAFVNEITAAARAAGYR